ncbi:MAG: hypothetical protein ACHQET_02910, partial [Chitinophagales bacterium]
MNSLFIRLFFKQYPKKIFYAVSMLPGDIKERVFLKNDFIKTEVTDRHSIVCQTPFCLAVRSGTKSLPVESSILLIEVDNKPVASLNLKLLFHLQESNESILVFEITKVK